MPIQPTEYYIKNALGEYEPVHFKTDTGLVKVEDTGGFFSKDNAEEILGEVGANLAESTKLQVNSAMSKAVLRRKGYFDSTPAVANKRVLVVGACHAANKQFIWHDLISGGIPFHICTFSAFMTNYNTDAWKAAYDIIIIAGTYVDNDTATPSTIKTAIQAIIAGNFYKLIQTDYLGMKKTGETEAYWFADLGVTVDGDGKPTTYYFADPGESPTFLSDVGASDIVHKFRYDSNSVSGASLTMLVRAALTTSHVACAAEASKKWAVIGTQAAQINSNYGADNIYNSIIHYGKLVWYLRGLKSHIAFNRISAKRYVAWGWDCDTTNDTKSINRILEISGNRPVELGIVTSKLTESLASFYRSLQNSGVKIVSHTKTHFQDTIPKIQEFPLSIDDLDKEGLISDGIVYTTYNSTDPELVKILFKNGYLAVNHNNIQYGRGTMAQPIANCYVTYPASIKAGGAPLFGCCLDADVTLMNVYGQNAATQYAAELTELYSNIDHELPAIGYKHDLPPKEKWDGTSLPVGNYFNSAQPDYMERRMQFYRDIMTAIDATGFTQIKRSEALELIYAAMDCVSISGETVAARSVTTKVVSKRRIHGLTIAIPVDSAKTIASVTIDGIATTVRERSSDSKWEYVSLDAVEGYEHTIVVTYV